MEDDLGTEFGKGGGDGLLIAHVDLGEDRSSGLRIGQIVLRTAAQIVDDEDVGSFVYELVDEVRPDESGPTGHDRLHVQGHDSVHSEGALGAWWTHIAIGLSRPNRIASASPDDR